MCHDKVVDGGVGAEDMANGTADDAAGTGAGATADSRVDVSAAVL